MSEKSFSKSLTAWYQKAARDLPWRHTQDPYKIWISEVMLQQTTVNAVIPYYHRWIKRFADIESVARADLQEILKVWQGLGYYQRAKNIHRTAKILLSQYDGQIPNQADILKTLPGFGPYTRGAVLSIAFDQRYPIIDANVRRVVMRQLGLHGLPGAQHNNRIHDFLQEVMPQKGNHIFNQALMELGALICRSRNPQCHMCPVQSSCAAYRSGEQELIPQPKKVDIKRVKAVIAVIRRNGEVFIQKRGAKGLFADLWEFPGGKVEAGEEEEVALRREIKEELDVEVISSQHLINVEHYYTQFRAHLSVWDCQLAQNPALNPQRKWVDHQEIRQYPMPSGSAKIVEYLLKNKTAG
jgi:A/G-specific adenine glycosylase